MAASRSFAAAYLAGESRARALLNDAFRSRDQRIARVRSHGAPVTADVQRAVERTTLGCCDAPAALASLGKLASGAAVVVTGQQVGLFGGPLYSYYKAASAVAVARALEAESGVPCVPLFWLQTEDHDFAEIASACVPQNGRALQISLRTDTAHDGLPARASVAHRTLGPDIEGLLGALEAALAPLPGGADTMARLRAAYQPGRSLATAFGVLYGGLFAVDGLLLLDPRQPEIACAAVPLYDQALRDHASIARALGDRAHAIEVAGFDVQVPIRPDHALVFCAEGNERGARFRVRAADTDAMRPRLVEVPSRFSSSALLRPLLQDRILPTVAYVGGPGELSYFAELDPLYEALGGGRQRMPLVIPRARFRVVDARSRARLDELGLGVGDLECDDDAWRQRVARIAFSEEAQGGVSPADLRAQLLSTVSASLDGIDEPALARAQTRTRATITRAVDRFVARWERLVAERSTVTADRLARLRAELAPDGQPQERTLSLPWALARYGEPAWRALVTTAIDPFSSSLVEVG